MIYGVKRATELAADLVIEIDKATYVCVIDPTKVDRSTDAAPITEQKCWQITRFLEGQQLMLKKPQANSELDHSSALGDYETPENTTGTDNKRDNDMAEEMMPYALSAQDDPAGIPTESTATSAMYPCGMINYNYAPTEILTYEWKYRI